MSKVKMSKVKCLDLHRKNCVDNQHKHLKSILIVNKTEIALINTLILLKSACRCSPTAGRNSCSIVSGDVL